MAASSVGGGAYALQANVNALLAPVSIGPLPAVSLPAEGGGPYSASLLSANVLGLAQIDAAMVSTRGNSGTGAVASSASLSGASIAGLITLAGAGSECTATADGAKGSSSVSGLVVAGIPIATTNLGANTTIALPVGRVTLNEQRQDAAGIRVNAVHVKLDAALVSGDIVIGQSRCETHSSTARARTTRSKRTTRSTRTTRR